MSVSWVNQRYGVGSPATVAYYPPQGYQGWGQAQAYAEQQMAQKNAMNAIYHEYLSVTRPLTGVLPYGADQKRAQLLAANPWLPSYRPSSRKSRRVNRKSRKNRKQSRKQRR